MPSPICIAVLLKNYWGQGSLGHPQEKALHSEEGGSFSGRRNSLKIEILGSRNFMCNVPLSVVLDTEWPGCPAIWVRTSQDLCAHVGLLEILQSEKL